MKKEEHILNVAYVAKISAPSMFGTYFEEANIKPAQSAQKYHRLMAEGLATNPNVRVTAIGTPPISRTITKRVFFSSSIVVEGGVTYFSGKIVNAPILRIITVFWGTFTKVLRICLKKGNTAVVCDILTISSTLAAILAAMLTGKKTIGIVTDVPGFFAKKTSRLMRTVYALFLYRFTAYVFLTEQMNEIINKKKKPYIVIEGQADINMSSYKNLLPEKSPFRVCMYTGGIHKIYGIGMLVDAFIAANIPNAILVIYGCGDYEAELTIKCKEHKNICYYGVLRNEQIINEQIKATLLINPRPTDHEYTQYSFPSKNMEYMASGTPLLTTKLPGMPKEYYPHVYLIEDETVEGLKRILKNTLLKPSEELHEKGLAAKQFILEYKNNIFQANKLYKLISSLN